MGRRRERSGREEGELEYGRRKEGRVEMGRKGWEGEEPEETEDSLEASGASTKP